MDHDRDSEVKSKRPDRQKESCRNCGGFYRSADIKFCPYCGNALGEATSDHLFGGSAVSRPEYLWAQEQLNREAKDRLDDVHVGPMARPNAHGLGAMMREHFEKMTGRELREKAMSQSPLPWPANLSIGLEASASSISNNLIRQRDVAIIDAVSETLDGDDWMVCELRDRLIFCEQEGTTTVMLDGKPLAQFGQPEFEVVEEGHQKVVKGKQRFWRAK